MLNALPDGTDRARYLYLRDVDRAGLMWEWLRRDPAYVGWYLRAADATRGTAPAPLRWRLWFAEDPALPAPRARILWRADLDPGALSVVARPAGPGEPDGLPLHRLQDWLSIVRDADGQEHAVLSDGLHHIRLEVEEGTLAHGPVVLHYRLQGLRDAGAKLASVRRLAALCLDRCFPAALFPADPLGERSISLLRVADAVRAGASHREVGDLLFGAERTRSEWYGRSESLRSRVRRLVGEARRLAAGGYRRLMREADVGERRRTGIG